MRQFHEFFRLDAFQQVGQFGQAQQGVFQGDQVAAIGKPAAERLTRRSMSPMPLKQVAQVAAPDHVAAQFLHGVQPARDASHI